MHYDVHGYIESGPYKGEFFTYDEALKMVYELKRQGYGPCVITEVDPQKGESKVVKTDLNTSAVQRRKSWKQASLPK